jgi:hypothetical protein
VEGGGRVMSRRGELVEERGGLMLRRIWRGRE